MSSSPAQSPWEPQEERPAPRLLASAEPTGSRPSESQNLFRTVQFSADGTTLITSTWDRTLAAYVLPQDLLSPETSPPSLSPQGTTRLHSPVRSLAPSPFFSLSEPTTQTALVASNDHPIQLHTLFPHSPDISRIASYRLVNAKTEAYIAPTALLWPSSPGSIFLCGSVNRLDVFDVSREGEDGHYTTLETMPRSASGRIYGWKGIISALSTSTPDTGSPVLAAGSWNRWVALYDYLRTPSPASHWSLSDATDPLSGDKIVGGGVAQTAWSPCGRYLIINERNSTGLVIYDIRKGHRLLGVLRRDAKTQMRMGCDVFATGMDTSGVGNFEVWGGSMDGTVKCWEDAGNVLGSGVSPRFWGWKAHEAPVTNAALHPSGSVVVTSAGTLGPPSDSAIHSKVGERNAKGVPEIPLSNVTPDTNLKIWECAT
ncbi:hypothetical protein VUR80DRAFT_15 [Thermomyces stellatus]